MSISITVLSVSAALLGPGTAQWPPDPGSLELELPDNSRYAAAYAASSTPSFVVIFFSRPSPDGSPGWYALRRDTGGARQGVSLWASGSQCPALYATLDWLSDIRPPVLALNGLRSLPGDARPYDMRPRRGPVADGPTYWISGSGWGPDQSLVHLSMTSSGGYVADWAEATTHHLDRCWRLERPF